MKSFGMFICGAIIGMVLTLLPVALGAYWRVPYSGPTKTVAATLSRRNMAVLDKRIAHFTALKTMAHAQWSQQTEEAQ